MSQRAGDSEGNAPSSGASPSPRSGDGGAPLRVDFGGAQLGDVSVGDITLGDQVNVQGDYAAGNIDRRRGVFVNLGQPAAAGGDRNRGRMLDKVYQFWVKDLLEHALHEVVRIELGLETRPGAVERPYDVLVQRPEREAEQLAPGVAISAVFEELGGELLILGAPGAGKTTSLLELARDLIGRARVDSAHPIPVVFNLSTWAQRRPPFAQWLSEELSRRYDVPRRLARTWVTNDAILPLLDGLDEVPEEARAACVAAINAYRREHGLTQMAICSRLADYEALGAQLRLAGAVLIQPLSGAQVSEYLEQGGGQLEGLRQALDGDPALRELAETPLMLGIMSLAYQGEPVDAPALTDASPENHRRHLFDTYIAKMFARRKPDPRFPQARAMGWLRWLARAMQSRNQSVFYVEDLQPDLLPSRWSFISWLAFFVGVLSALAFLVGAYLFEGNGGGPLTGIGAELWLLTGLVGVGIGAGLLSLQAWALMVRLRHWRWLAGLIASVLFLGSGLFITPMLLLTFAYIFWLRRQGESSNLWSVPIRPVENLSWSWRKGLVWGSGVLLIVNLLIAGSMLLRQEGWWERDVLGLTSAILAALSGSLLVGFLGGLSQSRIEARRHVNEGMWRSARSAALSVLASVAVVFFLGTLLAAVVWALTTAEGSRFSTIPVELYVRETLLAAALVAPGLLLLCALWNGGWALLKHFLLRLQLWQSGALPWNVAAFLSFGAERLLLRRAGGGYLWVHRLLLEHMVADSAITPAIPPAVVQQERGSLPLSEREPAMDRIDAGAPTGNVQATKLAPAEAPTAMDGGRGRLRRFARGLPMRIAGVRPLLTRLLLTGALLSTLGLAVGLLRIQAYVYAPLLHLLTGHEAYITSLKFSPDGRLLAAMAEDATICVWHTDDDGEPVAVITLTSGAHDEPVMAWSPDGALLATATYTDGVQLWRSADGNPQQLVSAPVGRISSIAVSSDGAHALVVSGGWSRVRRLSDGALVRGVDRNSLAMSERSDRFVVRGISERDLELYSLSTGELIATINGHEEGITRARFSADGRLIVSEAADATVRIWRASDGAPLHVLEGQVASGFTTSITPTGQLAFSPDSAALVIWNADQAEFRRASDGALVAVVGDFDGKVLPAWSAGEPIFTPDSEHIRRGYNYIRLEDGALAYQDPPYSGIGGAIRPGMRADIAPDGRTVRIWRLGPP